MFVSRRPGLLIPLQPSIETQLTATTEAAATGMSLGLIWRMWAARGWWTWSACTPLAGATSLVKVCWNYPFGQGNQQALCSKKSRQSCEIRFVLSNHRVLWISQLETAYCAAYVSTRSINMVAPTVGAWRRCCRGLRDCSLKRSAARFWISKLKYAGNGTDPTPIILVVNCD